MAGGVGHCVEYAEVALRRCRWRWGIKGPGTAALDDLVAAQVMVGGV